MNPLTELRRLVNYPATSGSGTVVSVTATALQVTSRDGIRTLRREPGDATAYRIGDIVRINGDVAGGRLDRRRELYVL